MKVEIHRIKMKRGKCKGQIFETFDAPYGLYISAHNGEWEIITHEGEFEIVGSYTEDIPMTREQEKAWAEMQEYDFIRCHGKHLTGYEIEKLLNGVPMDEF